MQGFLMLDPSPLQELHSICIVMNPCLKKTFPLPPQLLHELGLLPGLHFVPLQVEHCETFSNETTF